MEKSIHFLGTSHGEPSKTRFCSSALYQLGENQILVDAGEPVTALLLREGISPYSIGTVLITHFHGDHVNGLFQLTYQMARYTPPEFRPAIFLPEEENIQALLAWKKATYAMEYEGNVDYKVFPPEGTPLFICGNHPVEKNTEQDTIVVTSLNTRHLYRANARSQAFLFEVDGLRILHTGDMTEELTDFPLKPDDPPCDLCICESTHFYWALDEALAVLQKAPVKRMIFNHVSPYWTDGNEQLLRQFASQLPYPTDIAFDGMKVVF